MLRHVVMFRWKPGTSAGAIEAIAASLASLPAAIPEVRSFQFGPDLGLNPANFDLVLVAEFDSVDDFVAYRAHPAHQAFIDDQLEPNLEQRVGVQYLIS